MPRQLIRDAKFLGIDESNHGLDPEFVVGVYSDDSSLISHVNDRKHRNPERTIESELKEDSQFRYLMFSEEFRQYFGSEIMKIIGIAELVNASIGLEKVIFDGELRKSESGLFGCLLKSPKAPLLQAMPRADKKIPLVNAADSIANQLYKYNLTKEGIPYDYFFNRIHLNFEYYKKKLRTV